jgi:hypothetical protein
MDYGSIIMGAAWRPDQKRELYIGSGIGEPAWAM